MDLDFVMLEDVNKNNENKQKAKEPCTEYKKQQTLVERMTEVGFELGH